MGLPSDGHVSICAEVHSHDVDYCTGNRRMERVQAIWVSPVFTDCSVTGCRRPVYCRDLGWGCSWCPGKAHRLSTDCAGVLFPSPDSHPHLPDPGWSPVTRSSVQTAILWSPNPGFNVYFYMSAPLGLETGKSKACGQYPRHQTFCIRGWLHQRKESWQILLSPGKIPLFPQHQLYWKPW